ncbi:MAG: hypothetical protein ABIW03_05030 [Sphingomicrobium sp.]
MTFENGSQIEVFTKSELDYLRGRVREEADAAVNAESVAATLIHVGLAKAYAERCAGGSDRLVAAGRAWMDDHRLW